MGQPTVILAKTIKGYGMGESGEAQNTTHQQKKMSVEAIRGFRDRFQLPVPDDQLEEVPYLKFEAGSPELEYMKARRAALGGDRPRRRPKARVRCRCRRSPPSSGCWTGAASARSPPPWPSCSCCRPW